MQVTELVNGLMSRLDELDRRVAQLTKTQGFERVEPPEIGPEIFAGPEWADLKPNQRLFLANLASPEHKGTITRAARASGITPSAHYNWLELSHPAFPDLYRKGYKLARECYAQMLLDAAVQRGVRGVDEPVYHAGLICGYKRKFSDQLLIKLLEAAIPEQFRSKAENEGVAAVKVVELESREE